MLAQGCDINIPEAWLHANVKKPTNKPKRSSANRCNTLVFTAKNANTKPSKKIKKFFSNTTETIAAIEITYIKSPEHKKKQNIAGKNWEKRASGTETNHRTTKLTKVRNLPLKNNQAEHKSGSKNKVTTELHMQWQKPKNAVNESTQNCARHMSSMPQNTVISTSKKSSATNFSISLAKAQKNSPFKNTIANKNADENRNARNKGTMGSKAYSERIQACSEPGLRYSTREKSPSQFF